MLKRPAPKKLSVEEEAKITAASAQQTGRMTIPKSYDPNYPVFDIPVNKKVLVYVPNHTVTDADGKTILRADRFAAHPYREGRVFGNVRCTSGIVSDSLGLDGSCPFCDAVQESWKLWNFEMDAVAQQKGIDRKAEGSKEILKEDSRNFGDERAMREAVEWLTFPIVLIDTIDNDGKGSANPKLTTDGKVQGTPMFYSIRKTTFEQKFGEAVDNYNETMSADVSLDNLGGLWLVLNYTYPVPEGKTPNKMLSAKNLNVAIKPMGDGYDAWAKQFDTLTDDWTPAKAQEVVVTDVLRSGQEAKEACDEIMKATRDKNVMFEIAQQNGTIPQVAQNSTADNTLANFGGTEGSAPAQVQTQTGDTPQLASPLGEMPNMGV